jgi:tRNA 2-selenouridine synthase
MQMGMNLKSIACQEALAQLSQFDTIIDVRSESEFQIDRLPGAINCPVLSDSERVQVGTLYKQVSPFDARRAGAALVADSIARHLRSCFAERPRGWSPLVYCWRGGERSASVAHVMDRIGWRVQRLEGGYRAFRRLVVDALQVLPTRLHYRVLCGATGSGKSRLLAHLERAGAQVLDLEALAAHRGSVLGDLPGCSQPSQKQFETRLWWALGHLDPARPVFVESESRKIGDCHLPAALLDAMRQSDCVALDLAVPQRIQLLREEYRHYEHHPDRLSEQLDCLTALHGAVTVERWKGLVQGARWDALVGCLLSEHYDPVYRRSIQTNYRLVAEARCVRLDSAEAAAFEKAARELAQDDGLRPGPVRAGALRVGPP